jgi:lipopolysaccharide transport system permease protein
VPSLLCGLVAWKWFASSVGAGAVAIASNSSLMRQVYLPKLIFPIIVVQITTFRFAIVFFVLLSIMVIYGMGVTFSWFAMFPILVVQLLLIVAVASMAAAIVPFFPDLKLIIDNALLLLFFLSGVFFRFSNLPEEIAAIMGLNPMAIIIESYREVLISGSWPDWVALGTIALGSSLLLAAAAYIFARFDRVYPKLYS